MYARVVVQKQHYCDMCKFVHSVVTGSVRVRPLIPTVYQLSSAFCQVALLVLRSYIPLLIDFAGVVQAMRNSTTTRYCSFENRSAI